MFNLADRAGQHLARLPRSRACAISSSKSPIPSQPAAGSPPAISGRATAFRRSRRGDWGTTKPDTCFNIGLTYEGLRALGTPSSSLADVPERVHRGHERPRLEARRRRAERAGKLAGTLQRARSGSISSPRSTPTRSRSSTAFSSAPSPRNGLTAARHARGLQLSTTTIVHFGYRDNIMQPRFEGVHDPQRHADGQPMAPLGTVLLGYQTNLEGLLWRVPRTRGARTQRHLQRVSRAGAGRGRLREISRSGRVRSARAPAGRRSCCRPEPK